MSAGGTHADLSFVDTVLAEEVESLRVEALKRPYDSGIYIDVMFLYSPIFISMSMSACLA